MASSRTSHVTSFACFVALSLGLGGCGGARAPMGQLAGEDSFPAINTINSIDFGTFCQEWALHCPEGDPASFPTDRIRWGLEETRAAAGVAKAVLGSGTAFTMTLSDWQDPRLAAGARAVGLDRVLAQINDFWTRIGLVQMVARDGVLQLHLDDGAPFDSKLGFRVRMAPLVELRFDAEGTLAIQGVSIAPAGSEEFSPLTAAWPRAASLCDLKLGDRVVTASPQRLMFEALIDGLNLADFDTIKFDYPQVVATLGDLLTWVRVEERTLDYGPEFFALIRSQLPKILPITPGYMGIVNALDALERFEGRAEVGQPAITVTQATQRALVCTTVAGGVTYNARFAPRFGISDFRVMGSNRIVLNLFGVSGGISGLPGRLIQFSRIDLTPEGVVVENVPLLGRIVISLDRLKSLNATCEG